jgi:calmodulin
MPAQVDQDNSGEIDFGEFCNVILKHKAATAKNQDEADTLDAFVALGGNVSDCPWI